MATGLKKEETNPVKILLVEDSEVMYSMTRSVLEFYRYKLTRASNGVDALKLFNVENFDFVLMDLAMPKMGGIECMQAIRAMEDPKKANVPIVAFTGNDQFYTKKELIKAGFNDLIEKPTDFSGISELIRTLVKR